MATSTADTQLLLWLPVKSKALTAVAYSAKARSLYLRFTSGEIYRYLDCPPETYREFLQADSKGAYFAQHIRDNFAHKQLPHSNRAGG